MNPGLDGSKADAPFLRGRVAFHVNVPLAVRLVRHFELPRPPIVFEVDLDMLTFRPFPQTQPMSRQPVVRRDMAVVVDEALPAATLVGALAAARKAPVVALRLFDVYRGPGVGPGKKSLAILVLMQDTERTLTEAEIEAAMDGLRRIVRDRFGGALRE